MVFVATEFLRQLLKFAFTALYAAVATVVVVGKQQFYGRTATVKNSLGVGINFRTFFFDGVNACRNQTTGADYFANAYAASADCVDVFEVAEGRNFDTYASASF